MKLTPRQPPGRTSRKARAFSAEIARLYADGYTCAAIREALGDVGIHVSRSTVQREVVRQSKSRPLDRAQPLVAPESRAPPSSFPSTNLATRGNEPPKRGRDVAAAFFEGRTTNSLVRNREPS